MPGASQSTQYVKDIWGEQWDDYQLRSITLGGNEEVLANQREYKVENLLISDKYSSDIMKWQMRFHKARLDQVNQAVPLEKPAKDIDEHLDRAQIKLKREVELMERTFKQ